MRLHLFDKSQTLIKVVGEEHLAVLEQEVEINVLDVLYTEMKVTEWNKLSTVPSYMGVRDIQDRYSYHMYRIMEEEIGDHLVALKGIHIGYDELKGKGILRAQSFNRDGVKASGDRILAGSGWRVGYVDPTLGTYSFEIEESVRLDALRVLLEVTGAEIRFQVTIKDNIISDKRIDFYKQLSFNKGKRYAYGGDLIEVVREENRTDIITAFKVIGKDYEVKSEVKGEDPTQHTLSIKDIEWSIAKGDPIDKPKGTEVVQIPDMTNLYGYPDGSPRMGIYEDTSSETARDLIQGAYEALVEYSRPQTQFKALVASGDDVELGETVAIIRPELSFRYLTRVFKIRRDYLNNLLTEFEFGDVLVKSEYQRYKDLETGIRRESNRLENIIQTSANGKNRVFRGPMEPTLGMVVGDSWFKPVEDGETEIYQWDGEMWELIISTSDTTKNAREIEEAKLVIDKAVESADKANKEIDGAIRDAGFTSLEEVTRNLGTVSSRADSMSATAKEIADRAVTDAHTARTRANKAVIDASNAQGSADTALSDAKKALTDVSSVDKRVTTVVSDIDGKLSRKTEKTDHDALKGTVSTQGTVISQTAEELKSKASKSEVDTLQGTVSTQGTSITQNATDIKTKASSTTVNALTGRVSSAETGITQNANAIKLKASNTEVDAVKGRVTTAESSLSVLPGQIASKASNTVVNNLTGRVSTAETGITQNANDIKLRATNTTVSALTGRVSTAESTLSVLPGQISSKVSQAEVDASIDGIEIGGRNYFVVKDLTPKPYPLVGNDHEYVYNLIPNTTYTISTTGTEGATFRVNGGTVNYSVTGNKGYRVTTDSSGILRIGLYSSAGETDQFINGSAKLKLEKGNIATDWTPAPEDTDAKIDHIETEWTQTFDTFSQTVSGIDGRVTAQKQTIDSISSTVSGHGDRISTVEQTASGLQTTVASKASQSEVTQLSDRVDTKVTSSQVNNLIKTDRTIKDTRVDNRNPDWYQSNYSRETVREFKLNSVLGMLAEGRFGILETIVPWANSSGGGIKQTLTTDHSVWERSGTGTTWGKWKKTADVDWVGAQISVLENNINLRVIKGDVMSQINVEAGRTLIQSGKVLINANSTTITGTAFIDGAVMKNASMDGAVIKNATISSAKIANLDVDKISGNLTRFVKTYWESATGGSVTSSGDGILSVASDGSQVQLSRGMVYVRNSAGNNLGQFGYVRGDFGGPTHNVRVQTSLGTSFGVVQVYNNTGSKREPFRITTRVNGQSIIDVNGRLRMDYNHIFFSNYEDQTGGMMARVNSTLRITGPQGGSANSVAIYGSTGGDSIKIAYSVQSYSDGSISNHMWATLDMHNSSIVNQSDARVKKNITPGEIDSLSAVMGWEMAGFNWKDPEAPTERQFSVIAQSAPDISFESHNGYLNINSSKQLQMTTHAVQQLAFSHEITSAVANRASLLAETHEEKIRRLEDKITELERKVV